MHTIREITRLATMLAGLIAPQLRLGFVSAPISCKHCRSARNNPHCAPRHVIYYSIATLFSPVYLGFIIAIHWVRKFFIAIFRVPYRKLKSKFLTINPLQVVRHLELGVISCIANNSRFFYFIKKTVDTIFQEKHEFYKLVNYMFSRLLFICCLKIDYKN